MLSLVSPDIERYAVDHTSPLPEHLEELTRVTYEKMSEPEMLSGPIEGSMLQLLVWATGARRVLEIGCFTGFSAQMMAAALPEDGRLVTCDIDPEAAKVAQAHFDKSPHGHKIELRLGPALDTMESLAGPFELVFIDADKGQYVEYYERALDLLADRGIIAVDNTLWGGRVLDPQSDTDRAIAAFNAHVAGDARVRHVLLPIRDGVTLVTRNFGDP
jgi:caffeoyl-CoA O-methyltransferase